jgi:hypothetical protein
VPSGRSRLRASINHRTRPKPGNLLRNSNQPIGQPAVSDSDVYHMIATKDRAHLRCGQNDRDRQAAR